MATGPNDDVARAMGKPPPPPWGFGPGRFVNRELSSLEFQSRVLDLAGSAETPPLERAKFLAIFSGGLDEFFQVRVAGLKEQFDAGVREPAADGRTVLETRDEVREKVLELVERAGRIYTETVRPALSGAGIEVCDYASLGPDDLVFLRRLFARQVFPVLTPLAVDPGHPFPKITSLSLNLAVTVDDAATGESRFARVKVPALLARFVALEDGIRLVPLEQVMAANLADLFPGMRIGSCFAFRVTRNSDLELDRGDEDLLEAVEVELRRRRFGRAVRLEIDPEMTGDVVDFLLSELELDEADVYRTPGLLDLGAMWSIARLDRPDLAGPAFTPRTPPRLTTEAGEAADLFAVLRERDVLVHHPYDSFASTVEAFVSQAAADPDVLAIKQTLYRTTVDSPFVSALVSAAGLGKQVAALVEVTARFEERRNITWAKKLEDAGVHVVYGVLGLKTHSKTALVVRREQDGIRRYCHIGTGNYNSETARDYEDLGLFTSDPTVCSDVASLFNHLTGFSAEPETRAVILSPWGLRPWVLERIAAEAEAGEDGRIAIKVNGVTDPDVIDALYLASQAGVRIELIVRGICSLLPGVPGLSEHITVRSIVGRYLEHSRLFRFGQPEPERSDAPRRGNPASYFIGSADLMERNLDRRIETVVPVRDAELCGRLETVLELDLADDESTWALGPDARWSRLSSTGGLSAQRQFAELARERSRRRRASEGTT